MNAKKFYEIFKQALNALETSWQDMDTVDIKVEKDLIIFSKENVTFSISLK